MAILTTVLVLVHAGVAALWGGSMAYSLLVVQQRLPAMLGEPPDEERLEDAHRVLAQGNRWPVAGLIAALWLTGAALVAVHPGDSAVWWAAVAAKAALLAAASGLFWWVSWRGWPRRVFALPAELPVLRRRFRSVALTMAGLVAAAFLLGVVLPP
jgi:Flp pilus assembly protein TadB